MPQPKTLRVVVKGIDNKLADLVDDMTFTERDGSSVFTLISDITPENVALNDVKGGRA